MQRWKTSPKYKKHSIVLHFFDWPIAHSSFTAGLAAHVLCGVYQQKDGEGV